MKKLWNLIPYFPSIPIILFVTWLMLHDLPETSKGGFWYYFWPMYVIGISLWAFFEIGVRNFDKWDKE